jgi:AcrR family transcriptional regulator
MTDPRTRRTRAHVLSTVHRMLSQEPVGVISFTTLGREADVARRTLYVYWDTIAHVLSDAAVFQTYPAASAPLDGTLEVRLRDFLTSLRSHLDEPVMRNSVSLLLGEATRESVATITLEALQAHHYEHFVASVGDATLEEYLTVVGPLALSALIARRPISDELLESLVANGAAQLAIAS